ncbi:hypothetical protein FE782_02005 [Paenibacillus antri]|uniref:AAA+ ATPase domain-containing protein n=1 Tax=Paenibacillus antri TaxID=2582848 RepID=A0A5R9GCE7_9BACL|nr:AAA family ATPase [Paenibacillus antri]TLS54142.1 hypothetical protein FE782_02005 [Paenibacillus antri]
MELLYIWFRWYGPFHHQGFHLTAECRFHFDWGSGVLSVSPNPEYVPDFFRIDKENKDLAIVTHISAIVGQNGAGKTSFLNYIKNYLVRAQGKDVFEALVVLRNEHDETIILYDDTAIRLHDVKDPSGFLLNQQRYRRQDSSRRLPDSSVLFFSNIFDHAEEDGLTNYYNLSTNYLIRGDKKRRMDEGVDVPGQTLVDVHRDEDLNRQVLLVHEYPEKFKVPLPVRIPNHLIVKIRDVDGKDAKSLGRFADAYQRIDAYVETKLDESRQRIQGRDENRVLRETKETIFHYRAYRIVLWSFFKEMTVYSDERLVKSDDLILSLEPLHSGKKTFQQFARTFLQAMINRNRDAEVEAMLRHKLKMLDYFDARVDRGTDDALWTDPTFMIPIQSEALASSESSEFIKNYRRSYRAYAYLDFDWPLSSGEKAFLNFFARLYSRADGQPYGSNERLTDRVLLLIDEGELYLHPEWQRRFIDHLIRFVSVIYGDPRRIQIILTSHSPFLLSDLPRTSVLYLKREGVHSVVTDGVEEGKSTFAGNIHDMFATGFFMNTTIGEFARQKINDVIAKLKALEHVGEGALQGDPSVTLSEEEAKSLLSIIRLIGEPLIAGRLLDMYENLPTGGGRGADRDD